MSEQETKSATKKERRIPIECTCAICGKTWMEKGINLRRTCSDECFRLNQGNINRGKILVGREKLAMGYRREPREYTCAVCGKKWLENRQRVNRQTCSAECLRQLLSHRSTNPEGTKLPPGVRLTPVECTCEVCGKKWINTHTWTNRACSKECQYQLRWRARGVSHPPRPKPKNEELAIRVKERPAVAKPVNCCTICGAELPAKTTGAPTGLEKPVCSLECRRESRLRAAMSRPRLTPSAREAAEKRFPVGENSTATHAMKYSLVAPSGQKFTFLHLARFVMEHSDAFPQKRLKNMGLKDMDAMTILGAIESGLGRLAPWVSRREESWNGWRWNERGENTATQKEPQPPKPAPEANANVAASPAAPAVAQDDGKIAEGIQKALDYIQANCAYVEKAIQTQTAIWRGERVGFPPLALSCNITEEQNEWLPAMNYKEIHYGRVKMFVNELRGVVAAVNGNYGAVPSMRANMGCGIISSLFGMQQKLFEDKMPWMLHHVPKEEIKPSYEFRLRDSKEFAYAMKHIEYMANALRERQLDNVFVYPLDLQGPVDTAHLTYGDAIFYDLIDDPEFVHRLLDVSGDAMDFAMRECFKRIPRSDEFIAHYNHLIIPRELGGVKISEDTTTLLSPAHINEFALPHLRKTLERFNGGYVHYCGKNDHLLDVVLDEPLVRGINFGNPEKHDMAKVLERCREARKVYAGWVPRHGGESHFDYFKRILGSAYDRETGRFYIILSCGCTLEERGNVIGEFERAAVSVVNEDR